MSHTRTDSLSKGKSRKYLHTYDEAVPWNQVPGTFTPWQPLPEPTDVLFYEGLHGGVVTPQHNVAQHVDLLVGVVPIVNLEWIQKLIRDTSERGHSREAVMDSVVRSMEDYINYITPQFSRTHLNFQRVPTVDTSNPFAAKGIPSLDESFVVIHFRNLEGILACLLQCSELVPADLENFPQVLLCILFCHGAVLLSCYRSMLSTR